jgi:hypothetical protein
MRCAPRTGLSLPSHNHRLFLAIAIALIAIRIPFYWTGHIQEDAFIIFRVASNLANTGVYGFNPGERVSACTTHFSVFLSALLHLISPGHFILLTQLAGTAAVVLACYLLASTLFVDRQALIVWAMLSLTPIALLISHTGMETPWVVLCVAMTLWSIVREKWPAAAAVALFLLPWTRPDAILIGGLLIAFAAIRGRKVSWALAAALTAGVCAEALFNQLYFGTILNQSIIAKQVAFHPEHSISAFLDNLVEVLGALAVPISTKFLFPFRFLFLSIEGLAIGWLIWKTRDDRSRLQLLLLIVAIILAPVAAYAAGGILYPWYLWTGQFLIALLLLAAVMEFRRPAMFLAVVALCAGALIEWALSFNTGFHESRYRAGVGRYIRSISNPSDSIMLEPIGYIPYFAERYTHDAIGLASPRVTEYRERFGEQWWIRYLMDFHPTFYIERDHLRAGKTLDNHQLSQQDWDWFKSRYELIRTFHYRPAELTDSKAALRLLRLGNHADYDVYRLRQ